ncbi:gliding motility-associated ABC transporter substrate-binding protein GldG [Aggregatimonas sangjinii]|uniref:Gliding motility-associated ABC transporter substrate-binding protein GldG n=1 Tax=Aggregatimonas sangjinii TaxID=2583587 RepID=A0A5B7SSQ3_9FLAO|nr:gliding motility-associated ABC transporter substrate-binding protein GldG [Aggregatimonas sangjinii]QCW99693.1 gliding motility-associated ABC transporter substrate-binding protein GldG [Aggregatimonas sangjinii]
MKKTGIPVLKALAILVLVNILAEFAHTRFDLTEDRRYTLSEPSIATVEKFTSPVIIDVLLEGKLPPEFVKLRTETQQLLEEFAAENDEIEFTFVDPLDGVAEVDATIAELQGLGLTPTQVTVQNDNKVSQEIIFPWAMVTYNNRTVKVPLLKNKQGASTEERINNSVQHLEYAFADAFTKTTLTEKKRVAVIKGNGELGDIYLADFLTTVRDYYNIGAITLDSVVTNPQKVLNQLKEYDLALVAKPTEAFSEAEKYVLDQYIVNGGKSVWLVDQVNIALDRLFNNSGSAIALPYELGLTDFFFKYGVRINPNLISDMYFTQIVLATGDGKASQYEPLPWLYHPMVFSQNNHPINTNLEAIRFQFANAIDTIANAYTKTIILKSSPLSKVDTTPRQVRLSMIDSPPDKEVFNNGGKAMAVLIEGDFSSAYANRVKPLKLEGIKEKGNTNKMLVVSDGDIIKNQLRNGRPLELGYDKWTSNYYGNKEFLVNAFNYLLDDTGLINIRNKQVAIPFLDEKKIIEQRTKWQLLNIGLPVVLVAIFGLLFNYFRKRKYGS